MDGIGHRHLAGWGAGVKSRPVVCIGGSGRLHCARRNRRKFKLNALAHQEPDALPLAEHEGFHHNEVATAF